MLGALDVVPEWGFALTSTLRQPAGETVFSSHADIHRSRDRTTATQRSPNRHEADLGLFPCRLTAESVEDMLLSPHSSVQIRCAGRGHAGDSATVVHPEIVAPKPSGSGQGLRPAWRNKAFRRSISSLSRRAWTLAS